MWYTTPFGEEFFDGSNGQTLICARKCKHYGTKMFRNMKQHSSWDNSFTTYDRISPSLFQKSQLFLGTAKVENFATLAFSFADSDPTTALHNDISYPNHLESQWRESLFPSLPVPDNSRQRVKAILCCKKNPNNDDDFSPMLRQKKKYTCFRRRHGRDQKNSSMGTLLRIDMPSNSNS